MKTKIKELCQAAGITTAYQLQKKTDLSPSQAARLYRDEVEAISLSVLEKLCVVLDCEPNDIFGYNEPQTAKPQTVKVSAEKPASKPGTPKKAASIEGMLTLQQVADRLNVSRKSVNDYVNKGKLKATKGKQNHNFVSEADYLEFEAWYKENILKQI
jgi:DNA-binding Xre family transcriptional regulator